MFKNTSLLRLHAYTSYPPLALIAAVAIATLSAPVALLGVFQLSATVRSQLAGPGQVTDFLAIYSGARLLLTDTSHLYANGAAGALESMLSAGSSFNRPFSFSPHAALLLAPLALLEFGAAYAVWLAIGLACLAAATWLLAPGRAMLWLAFLVVFLPAQFGLIMGQTSAVALLGFALFVRLVDRQPWAGLVLSLSPLAWKPQLLPTLAAAVASARRWRTLVWLVAIPAMLSGAVLLAAGPALVSDYRANSAEMWRLVSNRVWYEFSGQTLVGLFQALVQPFTDLAFGPYMVAAALTEALVIRLWWSGLRSDESRALQLAALPIAAVLVAPHALVYELTTWLASAWLLRYAEQRPAVRAPIAIWCLATWAIANVVTLTERDLGFPFGAVAGLFGLALITKLWQSHPHQDSRRQSYPPRAREIEPLARRIL